MSASSTKPVVRISDLHKSFADQVVLDGLNLEVQAGECLGIMGGSGTGKSVALRHVIGLMQPDSGRVEVFGREVAGLSANELRALRRRVGYVFQEGALVGWMTVEDNLALPLRERGKLSEPQIAERVAEALETVHVVGAGQKFPSEISGGMKKRVSIARALITKPELVLYDEPNAGLDPEISRSINALMREVSEKLGVTSLVVEHRVECLRRVADRVLFIHEGKALVNDITASFFQPSHPRLMAFLGHEQE
ncbi:MAG TPA: ATP-binding cassette domain-containing protein [Planctomycetes bacterium]|nr:ATP-binding cassette domain-containing protein [Planctomycetota bacterium]HIL37121.1 ATP-binding cassette domain-containing protein [Planctomycetota bacterium]